MKSIIKNSPEINNNVTSAPLTSGPESTASITTEIVQTTARRVEVIGVPGARKTTMLCDRSRHLVDEGVSQKNILILGFANTTADTLRERLRQHGLPDIRVCTCHAFASQLVRENLAVLGRSVAPKLVSEQKMQELLRQAIQQTREEGVRRMENGTLKTKNALTWLDQMNTEHEIGALMALHQFQQASKRKLQDLVNDPKFATLAPYVRVLRRIFRHCEMAKRDSGNVDYGDMLQIAIEALESGKVVMPAYEHLLIDEFQDCSPHQVRLICALAQRIRNIMVVGDTWQAVYGFAGAHHTPLGDVLQGVKQLHLTKSFRLTRQNADAALAVLPSEVDSRIDTDKSGATPVLVVSKSLRAQTAQVAEEIEQLLAAGVPAREIAVLARTRDSLAPVERALRALGVPVKQLGTDADPKHVMRVVWLVHQVERAMTSHAPITARRLRKGLKLIGAPNPDWERAAQELAKVETRSLEGRYQLCRTIYLRLLGGVRKCKAENVEINRWVPLCRGLADALALKAEVEGLNGREGVTSATIHGAKGLEWAHVFIVGATQGLLPSYHARGDRELEEERRLLYVAVTRASKQVQLYHAPVWHAPTRQRLEEPCGFLSEAIRAQVLQVVKGRGMRRPVAERPTRGVKGLPSAGVGQMSLL